MNNSALVTKKYTVVMQTLLMGAQLRELRRKQMQKTAVAIAGGEPMFYLTVVTLGRFEKMLRDQGFSLLQAVEQLIDEGLIEQINQLAPKPVKPTSVLH